MGGDEVMHHVDEGFVVIVGVIHHGTKHGEDVGSLGIGDVLISVSAAGRDQSQTQPQGPSVVGRNPELVLFEDSLPLPLPELEIVLDPVLAARLLNEETRREFSESL